MYELAKCSVQETYGEDGLRIKMKFQVTAELNYKNVRILARRGILLYKVQNFIVLVWFLLLCLIARRFLDYVFTIDTMVEHRLDSF